MQRKPPTEQKHPDSLTKQIKIPDYVVTESGKEIYTLAEDFAKREIKNLQNISRFHTIFTEDKSLEKLLVDTKSIVDFGISTGIEVLGFKEKGWKLIGYDFSASAIHYLNSRGIETRAVDLNSIDKFTGKLTYQAYIQQDLASVTNIVSLKTLQYLDNNAMQLLLFSLLDTAKPGSVFFFTNFTFSLSEKIKELVDEKTRAEMEHQLEPMNNKGLLKFNYIASFFAPRIDIEFLRLSHTSAENEKKEHEGLPRTADYFKEIVVMRKRNS